jgi:KDO2-lipid IV(A) lauroyltransferase
VKQHFEAIGISLFETANAYYASDKKIKKMLTINNEQHFTEALKKEALSCFVLTLCH